jgi:hypothetical protein
MKNLLSSSFLCSSRLQHLQISQTSKLIFFFFKKKKKSFSYSLNTKKKYLKKMSTSTLHRNFHTSQFLSFTLSLQLLFLPQVHSHKHHSRYSLVGSHQQWRSAGFFFVFRSFFSSLSKSFYRFFSFFFLSLLSFHFLSRAWLRCCRAAGEMDSGLKV